MKIYINWESCEFYTDKKKLIENLLDNDLIFSFNEWLQKHYFSEDIFSFNENEKEKVKKLYDEYLDKEIECLANRKVDLTVLEIQTNEEIIIKKC
jgi:hypothetical protein